MASTKEVPEMHDNMLNKNLPHSGIGNQQRSQTDKDSGPQPLDPRGDIFHATLRGQPYRQGEPEEEMEGHDIVNAVQRAHEATVALWLAGSWRCNLGAIALKHERPACTKQAHAKQVASVKSIYP